MRIKKEILFSMTGNKMHYMQQKFKNGLEVLGFEQLDHWRVLKMILIKIQLRLK